MEKIINIKYTKNIDNFIINSLPYIELFLKENSDIFCMYANEYICEMLSIMYGNRIKTCKIKNAINLQEDITELDVFLNEYYPNYYNEIYGKELTKMHVLPLNPQKNDCLRCKKYVCIFPKFNQRDTQHSMTLKSLDEFIKKVNFNKMGYEIYIIGNAFEKINTKYGKDIENFNDIISYLKNCNLFITSESQWKYIALLCNCRNLIVYNTNEREQNNFEKYNPYNSNIYTTNNLQSDELNKKILEILN